MDFQSKERGVVGRWAERMVGGDALLFPNLDGSLDAPTTAKVGVAKNARAAASPVLAAIADAMGTAD